MISFRNAFVFQALQHRPFFFVSSQIRSRTMASCERPAATGKCVPCESLDKSHLMSYEEVIASLSSELPLWKAVYREGEAESANNVSSISRRFIAKNFKAAMDCLNRVGDIAEREGHHPDLHLTSYRDVEIVLYTHSVGGVTRNDLILAKMFDDEVSIEYSPKWLREHPEAERNVEE